MSDRVQCYRDGLAGRITLTHPQSLNGLNMDMIRSISVALSRWRDDDEVSLIIIDALGDRAFCAGGDVRAIYVAAQSGDFEYATQFWREEYQLNAQISMYPKPIVSFLHGFVMGGGVGLGCHASHRIACETTQVAMPECAIGLVPDVGGTMLLGDAPGAIGEYLTLTGARMSGASAIYAGFADHFVHQGRWGQLKSGICQSGDPDLILKYAGSPEASELEALQPVIDDLFSAENASEIVTASQDLKHTGALYQASPLSLAAGLRLIRQARHLDDIREVLEREFCFTSRAVQHSDFLEGIRALIIDKEKSPAWQHASVSEVEVSTIDALLSPLKLRQTVFSNLYEIEGAAQ